MAARQTQQPSQAPFILLGGLVVAGSAFYTGWPGVPALWLALVVTAWMEPPVMLTGKKDASGYPTPAGPGEEKNLQRFTMWRELKWRLVIPNSDWGPGWPVFGSFIAGLVAAFAAFSIPTIETTLRFANSGAAFLIVAVTMGVRRRTLAEDMCPGARVDTLPELAKSKPQFIVAGAVAAAAAGGCAFMFIPVWDPASSGRTGANTTARVDPTSVLSQLVDYGTRTPLVAAVALAVLAFLAVIAVPWTDLAIGHWRVVVAARKEWRPRWQALKFDPAPFLVDRQQVGPAVVDTFMAPPGQGSMAFWPLAAKIMPTIGAGTRVAVIETPNEGPDGPVPGTQHPLRFEVAAWPMADFPDLAEADLDPQVVAIAARCALAWALDEAGALRPVLLGIEPIHGPESPCSAWESKWAWPGGPSMKWLRDNALSHVSGYLNCEALADQRRDSLYFGALIAGAPDTWENEPDISFPVLFERIQNEDVWSERWKDVLKQGARAPVPEQSVRGSEVLADGVEIHRQAFTTRVGVDPREFTNGAMEKKVATALVAAPFCTIAGWIQAGDRKGDRHSQAFVVYWSKSVVPGSPVALAPVSRGYRNGSLATEWVLTGLVGKAFDAARLSRPEVTKSVCLTNPKSRSGHIWEITLRLHDGITLSDVRGAVGRLKSALGVPWMRVTPSPVGCVLFAGAEPGRTDLARPSEDRRRLKGLDWEQAWLDSGVSGVGGLLPDLFKEDVLPHNQKVEVLDFKLPTGVDVAAVKNAVSKLMASTNNAFIEVRHGSDASTIRLLVCEVNPLPERVGFDFEAIDRSTKIPFATGVEGEPIEFDHTESPHVLLAGMTGAGKLESLSNRVPVPISERFPTGWATIGQLRVGDFVYAADGSATKVVALSEIVERPVHAMHFSDGQVIECGPDHLWKVSSAKSRRVRTPILTTARAARFDAKMAEADRLRAAAERVPVGTLVTLPDVCRIAGLSSSNVHSWIPKHLGVPVRIPTGKKTRLYDGTELVGRLSGIAAARGSVRLGPLRLSPSDLSVMGLDGRWLTQREIADILVGGGSTRSDRDRVKGWIKSGLVASQPGGQAFQDAIGYPLDECLVLLAEKAERLASCSDSGRPVGPLESVVTTEEMMGHLTDNGGRMNWAVRLADPIQGADVELAVDPYVLGAWLGDGTTRCGQFTHGTSYACTDEDLLTDQAHLMGVLGYHDYEPRVLTHPFTIGTTGLMVELRDIGVLNDKHIPAAYLRASETQRLDLLRGLMDTDGSIGANGACELSLCDERLATDALELIRSLGIKASMIVGPATITEDDPDKPGEKRRRIVGNRWRTHFTTTTQVFRLPRKAAKVPASTRKTQDWNYITDITIGATVPMRCISVDHPEHLYLTDGFIPTHNSVMAQAFLYGAIVRGWDCYVIDPVKGGADFVFARDRCRAFAATPFEAAGVMKTIYEEIVQRKTVNAAHGVGSIDELPEDIRPPHVFIFIDEFTSLMGKSLVPKTDDPSMQAEIDMIEAENHARTEIGVFAGKIAREARSAGVHLGLGTQKLTAKMLDAVPGGGDLKDLALDTLLPVPVSGRFPTGWARNDELIEGDLLYSIDGSTTPITGFETPNQDSNKVFEVVFSDGQRVKAGSGHWWWAVARADAEAGARPRKVTTEEMFRQPNAEWLTPAAAPIDGVLVPGDARRAGRRLARGRRIPSAWFRSSVEQRRTLLEACISSVPDGVDVGSVLFIPTHRRLARSMAPVVEIAQSLGLLVRTHPTGDGGNGWSFTLPTDGPGWRAIETVFRVPNQPTRCIAVEHPSHLFLVEGFIPTHNTNLARTLLGKGSFGDRASALRSPDDAPRLDGDVPKGRGLWEPLSSAAMVVQTWFERQDRLRAELVARVPEIDPGLVIDMSGFTGPVSDDLPGPSVRQRPVSEVEEVIELGTVELSLDDLEMELDDLDALDALADDLESNTTEDTDFGDPGSDAPERPDELGDLELVEGSYEPPAATVDPLDWDIDDDDLIDGLDGASEADPFGWDLDDIDPSADTRTVFVPDPFTRRLTRPDTVVFVDVDGVLFPHSDPPPSSWDDWGPIGKPAFDYDHGSPAMCRRVADLGGHLVWLTSWEDDMANASFAGMLGGPVDGVARGSEEYGWWKIDAALVWLSEHPEIRRVIWFDDELETLDGDEYRCDTISETLDMFEIEHLLIGPDTSEGLTPRHLREAEEWLSESDNASSPVVEVVADPVVGPAATNGRVPVEAASSNSGNHDGDAAAYESNDEDEDDPFSGPAWVVAETDDDDPFG